MEYTKHTFKQDHLIRDEKGIPIGRIILRDDSEYVPGQDLNIALLKVPLSFKIPVKNLIFYVDGVKYQVPDNILSIRMKKRDKDYIVSSFVAKVCK